MIVCSKERINLAGRFCIHNHIDIDAGNEIVKSIDDTKLQSRDKGEYGKGFYVSKTETNQPYYGKIKSSLCSFA